jgi:chorismate mutase
MTETNLLLKAYYEALYERLEAKKDLLTAKVRTLLREEFSKRWPDEFNEEKYIAYQDACMAFVDERMEYYNPIGIQYTFDRARAWEAFELELQLNWYDSRAEFQALVEAAREKAEKGLSEETLRPLAEELITEVGAFPEKSIISGYEAQPALGKLPDYVVARAIKEVISE